MGRSKITLLELGERLRAGKSVQEIAVEFKMTVRGVQKKCVKLDFEVSKSAALHQSKIILAQQIDAQAQLLKINESANRILDRLEAQLDRDQEVVYAGLEVMVLGFRVHLGPYAQLADDFLKTLQEAALPDKSPVVTDQIFKALAEIRKQLELLAKVAADWLEAKRLAAVYQAIIDEVGSESPECRTRIIRRLGGLQSSGLLFTGDGETAGRGLSGDHRRGGE